jgi:hypothetical protein
MDAERMQPTTPWAYRGGVWATVATVAFLRIAAARDALKTTAAS